MPDAHSRILGGSIASRRLNCPASFQEEFNNPISDVESIYASEGTAMHEAAATLLRMKNPKLSAVLGKEFNGHVVSQEDYDNLLDPALAALEQLEDQYGGGFEIVAIEKRVGLPYIPGAFGTVDVCLANKTYFLLADFKFGYGVKVDAFDAISKMPNAQLLFYASGCKAAGMIGKRELVVAVIQPTFEPHASSIAVTDQQLQLFEETLLEAIINALSSKPHRARGEWCRFAICKATCSLWTGALLDLSALGKPPVKRDTDNAQWGAFLAMAKHLVDSAVMYQKEIDQALIEHLRTGGKAPGFALKPAIKNRKWLDDTEKVGKALWKLGLSDDEIWQHKLQTFAVVDRAAKKLGVEIPEWTRPRPVTNDLVLTFEGDPRAVEPQRLTADFSAALKRLKQGQES